MTEETAELVLKKCMGHKGREVVLVVTDNELYKFAMVFYEKALRMGIESVFVCMNPRDVHGEEPPEAIAKAMTHADIALLITKRSLSHTNARRTACHEHGVRMASMPDVDPVRVWHTLDVDYVKMAMQGEQIAQRLRQAKEVEIVSDNGTRLRMKIEGRHPMVDTGLFIFPGAFGNLPAGEVCLAPLEGTAEGTLVIDGSMAGIDKLGEPITIRVEKGLAVDISSKELCRYLEPFGSSGRNIAELGIGINPNAEVTGNILEDEKATETVHIALGDNRSFGGSVNVACHLDGIVRRPRLFLDGVEFPHDALWPEKPNPFTRPKGSQPDTGIILRTPVEDTGPVSTGLYRILFQNSNEAQYVLDLESQRFLEVNPSFSRLTGFDYGEATTELKASDLIPPDSRAKYEQKRESRRTHGTDRYTLKLCHKNGDVKPVEVSVRKINLNGRDIVVGTMRDRTEQVQMEQTLRMQIKESWLANTRIHSLTEKLKNVPALSQKLLVAQDEKDVFEEALDALCDRTKLACSEATFYITEDQWLVPLYSSSSRKAQKVALTDDHPLANSLKQNEDMLVDGMRAVVPLRGRQAPIGVLDLELDPHQLKQMSGNEPAQKSYLDILSTLAEMIALIVDGLRLYNTVKAQSVTDSLTQVFNRRYFEQKLSEETQRALRYRRALSLIIIDLNFLKQINDTYGHQQGDNALCAVGDMLKASMRGIDIVCRWGGDEFAAIMPETALDIAAAKAETLLGKIKEKEHPVLADPSKKVTYSITIGVSAIGEKVMDEKTLMNTADEALYEAKRLGRDRIFVHRPA